MEHEIYVISMNKSFSEHAEKLVELIQNCGIAPEIYAFERYQEDSSLSDIDPSLRDTKYQNAKLIFVGSDLFRQSALPKFQTWQHEMGDCCIGWDGRTCVISMRGSNLLKVSEINGHYNALIKTFMDNYFDKFVECDLEYKNVADEDIANTDNDLEAMCKKAERTVSAFVATTATTGAIPIPFADAPLLIGQQVAMMAKINVDFNIEVGEDTLKSLASAALGIGGAAVAGRTIATNLLKLIPGIGTIAGGAISAGTAGLITLALGKAYIQVCKSIKQGQLDQEDLKGSIGTEALTVAFKEALKQGKEQ